MKKLLLLYCLLLTAAYSNAQAEGFCEIISVNAYCESNDLCLTVEAYTEGIQNQYLVFEYENGDSQAHPIFSSGTYVFSICGQTQQSIVSIHVGGELDGTQCSTVFTQFLPSCSTLDDDGDGITADVDCDDQDANTYPGAPEICDSKDNNCDGSIDEGLPTTTYYWDADLDGYGNPDLIVPDQCTHPGGRYVEVAGDCDDQDANVNPGATEILDNGIDDDCNPSTPDSSLDIDNDGDGQTENEGDCDDTNPNIYAGNTEIQYNGLDDDCNPATPDDDLDGDGYLQIEDCDDANPNVNPEATEIPNNDIDDDCNPATPDSSLDIDNDGDGQTENEGDCDDTNAAIYTGNTETVYNGIDDDCNPNTPDDDLDGDGYLQVEDCDDTNPNVNPGASEIPNNGIDDDCNPVTPDTNDCALDSDNDGTPDCQDGCPNDRKKIEPGDCGCGVVDRDRDNDGVADCNDVCNREDDTIDVDADGVPDCIDPCIGDQDSDGDGVLDCYDPCPNDPNNACNSNTCSADEVLICHNKNNGTSEELCVRENQLQRHLDHGDTLGGCNTQTKQANSLEDVVIYPNPTTGKFSVVLKNGVVDDNTLTITIKNTFGIAVYHSKQSYSTHIELDIKDRLKEEGLYFIFITDGNSSVSKKIIVTK